MYFLLLLLAAFAPALGPQNDTQPFTRDQLINLTRASKALGQDEIIGMVEKRGVDFTLTENAGRELRKAGAGDALMAAVKKASDDRLKQLRGVPAGRAAEEGRRA